jgi:rare lipoprotein A
MSPPASSQRKRELSSRRTLGRAALTFTLAIILLAGTGWDSADYWYDAHEQEVARSDPDPGVVIVALPGAGRAASVNIEAQPVDEVGAEPAHSETCSVENMAALSFIELPADDSPPLRFQILPQSMGVALAGASTRGVDLAAYARRKVLPGFPALYRAVAKRVAILDLPRIQDAAAFAGATVIGAVSSYNPYREGHEEGGPQTASGEPYDPDAWTAAVKADLRNQFGGIRFGKLYQPTFALVESGLKRVIVKINDVGPLKPGRVLDLNERSMRHFDPFLTQGLIQDVRVTLLPGEDWTPGPIGIAYAVDFAARTFGVAESSESGSLDSTIRQIGPELARLRTPLAPVSYYPEKASVRAEVKPTQGG